MVSDALLAEARKMFDAGLDQSSIARELELSIGTVRNILGLVGTYTAPKHPMSEPLGDAQIQKIAARYVSGESVGAICREEGVRPAQLYAALRELRIEQRSDVARAQRQQRLAEAIDMYERGETLVEIQQATGFNPTTFYRLLREAGVDIRRGKRRTTPAVRSGGE